ncbi:hypothetical protein HRbin17_00347 [bacterium HR17]|uniref:Putative zinc-finger domain-containing protein n=1 Tax=Candidatus Fervidibacter japonicus TaxID=2035412 RepID=A0A2H5X9I1_9BACT|nr:hypothetical protein HRbin17_00347 [bacterium HR17]
MRCEQSRRWMSLALDNLLTDEQMAHLRRHLTECVGCRAEWRLLRMVQKAMVTTPPAPMPYDLVPIVMERVRALRREQPRTSGLSRWMGGRYWRWVMATALPLVVCITLWGLRWRHDTHRLPDNFYLSAHVVNAARTTAAPAFAPISLALSSVQFAAGDEEP